MRVYLFFSYYMPDGTKFLTGDYERVIQEMHTIDPSIVFAKVD
jgi:hypothetical protein